MQIIFCPRSMVEPLQESVANFETFHPSKGDPNKHFAFCVKVLTENAFHDGDLKNSTIGSTAHASIYL